MGSAALAFFSLGPSATGFASLFHTAVCLAALARGVTIAGFAVRMLLCSLRAWRRRGCDPRLSLSRAFPAARPDPLSPFAAIAVGDDVFSLICCSADDVLLSLPPFPQTKGKHFVFGGAALAILGIGGYIPVYAIQFQQKKAGGG